MANFFLTFLAEIACSELNKKEGDNTASNLEFFLLTHVNITVRITNTQPLPYRLEWPNKKLYGERLLTGKLVQQEKKCFFHFSDFYILRLPRLPPLCLCVFSSLPLEPKRKPPPPKKNSGLRRLVAHTSQDSRTIPFFGEIHSEHKHTFCKLTIYIWEEKPCCPWRGRLRMS